jgi:hypothetical protein
MKSTPIASILEFKEPFPELEEAKYFIRKPKDIEDLVKHVATILG